MSLLLDALKRAEDSSGRRRRASGAPANAPSEPAAASPGMPAAEFPELTLTEVEAPPGHAPASEAAAAPIREPAPPAPQDFADAPSAASAEPPLVRPEPGAAPSAEPAERAPAVSRTPAADARSAARVLRAQAPAAPARPRRQAQILAGVALALLAALAALWWWADSQSLPPPRTRGTAAPPQQVSAPHDVASAPVQALAALPQASAAAPVAASASPPAPAASKAALRPSIPEPDRRTAQPLRATPAPATPHPASPLSPVPASAATPAQPGAAARPVTRAAPHQELLQQAYADFQAGRLDAAARAWREIVAVEPLQADAWLGLAVLAHRAGRREDAVLAYRRVLRIDPDNGPARAGLARLDGGAGDPLEESRLREAVARAPADAMLNSALARLLSEQGRWDEAQPFWFAAHAAAPQEPAHCFNLAVSLDRLHKPDLALRYYRQALALAGQGAPNFDLAAAKARVLALEQRKAPSTTP